MRRVSLLRDIVLQSEQDHCRSYSSSSESIKKESKGNIDSFVAETGVHRVSVLRDIVLQFGTSSSVNPNRRQVKAKEESKGNIDSL